MKLTFIKTQTGLIPDCDDTREILNKVKNGDGVYLCKYFRCAGACNTYYCEYKYKRIQNENIKNDNRV